MTAHASKLLVSAGLRDPAPLDGDPHLGRPDERQRQFVRAGDLLYEAMVYRDHGDRERARRRASDRELVPWDVVRTFRGQLTKGSR